MNYASLRTNKELMLSETGKSLGDMVIAGSGTVASTLAAIFYHLLRNFGAYQDLVQVLHWTLSRQT